jgi:hypothetical protein
VVKNFFDNTQRWLPGIARRAAVGLALAAGLAAGPAAAGNTAVQASQPLHIAPVAPISTIHNTPNTPAAPNTPAPTQAQPAPVTPTAPETPAAPSITELMPNGSPTEQSSLTLSAEQIHNAQAIVQAGQDMKLPPRAWVIAVATSMQETKLHNYGDLGAANDHDSLGLFQQRPTSGWGSAQELVNPHYAASAFYQGLTQVPGWQHMPLTDAAQAVQVSAFGDRYAQWEQQATDLVLATYHTGPYAGQTNQQ